MGHIEFFECPSLPHFSTDFDDTCFKIHGTQSFFSVETYLLLGLLSPLSYIPGFSSMLDETLSRGPFSI